MPLSNYGLDNFVAQGISGLTCPKARPIGSEFPASGSWLGTFVLRSIFTNPLPSNLARVFFVLIRRMIAAIEDYDAACAALDSLALAHGSAAGDKDVIATYFRALHKIESAIAMLYQSYDFGRAALDGKRFFEKDDGSELERLYVIYVASRHAKLESLPDDHLHPVWLRNDGICAVDSSRPDVTLAYSELENLLREHASLAETIALGVPHA